MGPANLDPSKLTAYENAAAGHEGVLTDESGELVIKPCTQAEVTFYETVAKSYPRLATYMPTYMGTLSMSAPEDVAAAAAAAAAPPVERSADDPGPMHGKHLQTNLSIVLGDVTTGFVKPNVLDLKLGARLWDDAAKQEKRDRLDKVANETTSGSLGFRIAGMKVWQGSSSVGSVKEGEEGLVEVDRDTNSKKYNKMYGRQFKGAEDVLAGLRTFLDVPQAGIEGERTAEVAKRFHQDIKEIGEIVKGIETRMYSASILAVYEGDAAALDKALKGEGAGKAHTTTLIDFAHASLVPGQGPDENMLRGIQSLDDLFAKIR